MLGRKLKVEIAIEKKKVVEGFQLGERGALILETSREERGCGR